MVFTGFVDAEGEDGSVPVDEGQAVALEANGGAAAPFCPLRSHAFAWGRFDKFVSVVIYEHNLMGYNMSKLSLMCKSFLLDKIILIILGQKLYFFCLKITLHAC
jgi:hypothetical protein